MTELARSLEGILFVAGRPVTISELAQTTSALSAAVEAGLSEVGEALKDRGLRLTRKGDEVQLVSTPEVAATVRRFLGTESESPLSRAALETLAIIAHREPLTRSEIDEIRGVGSDAALRSLQVRGLIREVGRAETLGRPILYATNLEFLHHFGLETHQDLPPLREPTPAAE